MSGAGRYSPWVMMDDQLHRNAEIAAAPNSFRMNLRFHSGRMWEKSLRKSESTRNLL